MLWLEFPVWMDSGQKKIKVAQIGLGHIWDFGFPSLQPHSYGGY